MGGHCLGCGAKTDYRVGPCPSPTLPAEVDRAREILDAKDQGWNEGVEACRKMLVSNGQPGLSSECLNLLIPTVPPSKEKP